MDNGHNSGSPESQSLEDSDIGSVGHAGSRLYPSDELLSFQHHMSVLRSSNYALQPLVACMAAAYGIMRQTDRCAVWGGKGGIQHLGKNKQPAPGLCGAVLSVVESQHKLLPPGFLTQRLGWGSADRAYVYLDAAPCPLCACVSSSCMVVFAGFGKPTWTASGAF